MLLFFFNEINGRFIDGYRIENGRFSKKIILKQNIQEASFLPLFLQATDLSQDFWCDGGGGTLGEVVIRSHNPNWHYTPGPGLTGGYPDYEKYINDATSGIHFPGSSNSSTLSSGQITSAATAILIAAPIKPDENGKCPEGYTKNQSTGNCDPICTGGKVYNTTTKNCECPEGTKEDSNGNCITGNPCSKLKILSTNLEFIQKIKDLNTKSTTVNKEVVYVQKQITLQLLVMRMITMKKEV